MRNDCKKEVQERKKNKQQGKHFDSEKKFTRHIFDFVNKRK
jgi:hypothetical protein